MGGGGTKLAGLSYRSYAVNSSCYVFQEKAHVHSLSPLFQRCQATSTLCCATLYALHRGSLSRIRCVGGSTWRATSFFYLTYIRRTSSLPSCLWSLTIFPSLPGSRLTIFYRDASSALLQLVNQWLNFPYSRSDAFRYGRKNTNPALVRIELTTSALAGVQVTY